MRNDTAKFFRYVMIGITVVIASPLILLAFIGNWAVRVSEEDNY
jgi:hypothetical protein